MCLEVRNGGEVKVRVNEISICGECRFETAYSSPSEYKASEGKNVTGENKATGSDRLSLFLPDIYARRPNIVCRFELDARVKGKGEILGEVGERMSEVERKVKGNC